MKARWSAASLSYLVATRRHCLILLKNRSIKLRARYRCRLKQIGSLRCRFGGNVRPCSLLAGKLPDPVRVVSRRRSCQRSCISSRPGTGERNLRIFVALRWRPKSTYFFAILLRAGSGRTDIGGTCGSRPASSGWPLSQNFRYNLVCRSVAARSMPRVGLKTKLRLAG
jgi:hypothetical protein